MAASAPLWQCSLYTYRMSVWGSQAPHNAAVSVTRTDRKSTRLNSSHLVISYAVFCLKKKHEHGRAGGRPGGPVPRTASAATAADSALLSSRLKMVFFFNDTATTEIYTLSLHDALPI